MPRPTSAPQKNTSYKDGEKLTFKVYYNLNFVWINAGNAQFNLKSETADGHKVYHITGDGKTAKSYELFFKVNDKYDTYIDVNRCCREVYPECKRKAP